MTVGLPAVLAGLKFVMSLDSDETLSEWCWITMRYSSGRKRTIMFGIDVSDGTVTLSNRSSPLPRTSTLDFGHAEEEDDVVA